MRMTYQAQNGHSARSDELHRHILRSHLAYLNQEETPTKLAHRRNLESLISEFLATVPHSAKFTFPEIAKVLNESVESNGNFSAYKAGSAFEALEKYATNLISHPWRREYKTVKLYSGFYKHSVESQLLGGSSMLCLLGYQFSNEGLLYLDEPVDPDRVARVALDCLVAYVECQMMVQICERVKSFKCSWFEISQIRQDYTCGIDEAVRILHQLKRNAAEQEKQDRWFREQENSGSFKGFLKPEADAGHQKTGILVDVSNTWPTYPSYNSGSAGPHQSKSLLSHSGVSSRIEEYPGRGYVSKSDDGIDGYLNHCLDESSYNFLGKCNSADTTTTRFLNSDDSTHGGWDLLQPSYHRDSSYVSDSHRTGYGGGVKETYSTQYGHMYPPHPMMPLGVPGYPIPHNYALPPRLCRCQMCCGYTSTHGHEFESTRRRVESNRLDDLDLCSILKMTVDANDHGQQVALMPHKYPQCGGQELESTRRRGESNRLDDPDLCSSILKMTVDGPTSKHFPVTSYQTNTTPTVTDVVLRGSSRSQSNKRGSYYDNVPSYESEGSFDTMPGQSLNPICDLEMNGSMSSSTLPSKSRSQNGTKPGLKKPSYEIEDSFNNMPGHSLSPMCDLQMNESLSSSSTLPSKSRSQKGADSMKPVLKKPSYESEDPFNNMTGHSLNPICDLQMNESLSSTLPSKSRSQNGTKPALKKSHSSNSDPPTTPNGKCLSGSRVRSGGNEARKWSCSSCTFYNAPHKSICDMCGRSQHPGPEVTPLVSGGRECPQCTLVNKKDCENCTACGSSLKDSPTYI